ncbi:MAG: hypothetical protein ACRCT1_23005 [Microcoleaceae cyanobacterium]
MRIFPVAALGKNSEKSHPTREHFAEGIAQETWFLTRRAGRTSHACQLGN